MLDQFTGDRRGEEHAVKKMSGLICRDFMGLDLRQRSGAHYAANDSRRLTRIDEHGGTGELKAQQGLRVDISKPVSGRGGPS